MNTRNSFALIGLITVLLALALANPLRPGAGEEQMVPGAPQPAGAPRPRPAETVVAPAPPQTVGAHYVAQPVPVPTPKRAHTSGTHGQAQGGRLVLPILLIAAGLAIPVLLFVLRYVGSFRARRGLPTVAAGGTVRTPATASDSVLVNKASGLGRRRKIDGARPRPVGAARFFAGLLLGLLLLGCGTGQPDPLPPDQYLENALSWLEANAVTAGDVDWEAVRAEAVALAGEPETTADTYPAIRYALAQLDDYLALMHEPGESVRERLHIGITAIYPENIVIEIERGSPAEETAIEVGDRVLLVDGSPPTPSEYRDTLVDFPVDQANPSPMSIRLARGERAFEVTLTPALYDNEERPTSRKFAAGEKAVGYLELISDIGTEMYPTRAQAALAAVDGPDTCGWMIDLRRNKGGNLWTYFAALGPLLGEGELGGFEYADGTRETWAYRDGKVYWAGEEREESYVRGPIYEMEQQAAPVALLVSGVTEAAGELVVVAFQGWGNVRTFGEPTLGIPNLVLHTPLSDGALLFVSGARGMDRNGMVYNGPITPDERVPVLWQRFGSADDPAIVAAREWLAAQPACQS